MGAKTGRGVAPTARGETPTARRWGTKKKKKRRGGKTERPLTTPAAPPQSTHGDRAAHTGAAAAAVGTATASRPLRAGGVRVPLSPHRRCMGGRSRAPLPHPHPAVSTEGGGRRARQPTNDLLASESVWVGGVGTRHKLRGGGCGGFQKGGGQLRRALLRFSRLFLFLLRPVSAHPPRLVAGGGSTEARGGVGRRMRAVPIGAADRHQQAFSIRSADAQIGGIYLS